LGAFEARALFIFIPFYPSRPWGKIKKAGAGLGAANTPKPPLDLLPQSFKIINLVSSLAMMDVLLPYPFFLKYPIIRLESF